MVKHLCDIAKEEKLLHKIKEFYQDLLTEANEKYFEEHVYSKEKIMSGYDGNYVFHQLQITPEENPFAPQDGKVNEDLIELVEKCGIHIERLLNKKDKSGCLKYDILCDLYPDKIIGDDSIRFDITLSWWCVIKTSPAFNFLDDDDIENAISK